MSGLWVCEMKVTKVKKSYYSLNQNHFCTVLVDQYLMKKACKIMSKYETEMRDLLSSNPEHCIKQDWSLAYPNGEQTTFHSAAAPDEYTKFVPGFKPTKIKNVFDIGDKSVHDKQTIKEVGKLLE